MKRVIFFRAFSVSKFIGNNIFYYQWTYRWTKNYRRKIYRRGISISKLITNEMIVQIPMKNFIDKYKDYDSVLKVHQARSLE
jgi:hypothetical protein